MTASTATSSSSAAATAGGCLQQQPASGEVEEEEEEILGEISHIEPSEHLRNVVPAYGSLDPAATVAGAALKGINNLQLRASSMELMESWEVYKFLGA